MPSLATDLRNKLDRVIGEARQVAEAGAEAALQALAVHHYEPYPHMDADARRLRNHLRAHARQLGDRQDRSGRLEMMQGLSACAAVDAVLRENLHGLELDQRCVELAAFALALTAWRYPGAGGYRPLPELHVACSGLTISAKKEEWLALAGDNTNLRVVLEDLYTQFKDAPVLGSLINPEIGLAKGSLFEMQGKDVEPLLIKALSSEKDDEKVEMGVVAQGLAKAANLLGDRYHWIITNVPYLKRGNQISILQDFTAVSREFASTMMNCQPTPCKGT